jgi:hypothetical protein
MSTLEVSNLNDGTTTVATTFINQGVCKQHVIYDGTGTAAITDSFNTSSLIDSATGKHTPVLTSHMSQEVTPLSTSYGTDGSNNYNFATESIESDRYLLRSVQWGVAFYDDSRACASRFGDLA